MPYIILWIFLVVAMSIVSLVSLYYLGEAIKKQARKMKFFAPIPQAGRFMFVMREGVLNRIVENVLKYDTDESRRFVRSRDPKKKLPWLARTLGVTWIGLYGQIKIFSDWRWVEFRQKAQPGQDSTPTYGAVERKESPHEFLQQFTYSIPMINMDLAGNDQANANALVTVYILDSEQAFFNNKDWIDLFVGIVQASIRGWVTDKDFNQVKEATADVTENSQLSILLRGLNGIALDKDGDPDYTKITPGGLFQVTGVAIWSVALQDLEPTGPLAAAQSKNRLAELEGNANITAAQKAAEVARIEAEGRANALQVERVARTAWVMETIVGPSGGPGSDAAEVLRAEMLAGEKSKLTTVVFSEKAVAAIPVKTTTP